MRIQLESWKALNLSFVANEESDGIENSYDLNMGHFFPEGEFKNFGVGFNVKVNNIAFVLEVETVFTFSTDEDITEEFKLSNFPRINAPAIAFPYIRSYISQITLLSGYDPIILPSINFVKMAQEKDEELKSE